MQGCGQRGSGCGVRLEGLAQPWVQPPDVPWSGRERVEAFLLLLHCQKNPVHDPTCRLPGPRLLPAAQNKQGGGPDEFDAPKNLTAFLILSKAEEKSKALPHCCCCTAKHVPCMS